MIKSTRFTKKRYITQANLHTVKMARKCVGMPTIDNWAYHCKPLPSETKKTGETLIFVAETQQILQQKRLYLFVQVTETFSRWQQWLSNGL